jgi:hypothetical protein
MNDVQKEQLRKVLESSDVFGVLKKTFGRAFTVQVEENGKGVQVRFSEKDSGNDWMTVNDMAALLQTDVNGVWRLCGARAQRQAQYPLPFFKIGKHLRFDRKKVQGWLQAMADSTPAFQSKAKKGRPRR